MKIERQLFVSGNYKFWNEKPSKMSGKTKINIHEATHVANNENVNSFATINKIVCGFPFSTSLMLLIKPTKSWQRFP